MYLVLICLLSRAPLFFCQSNLLAKFRIKIFGQTVQRQANIEQKTFSHVRRNSEGKIRGNIINSAHILFSQISAKPFLIIVILIILIFTSFLRKRLGISAGSLICGLIQPQTQIVREGGMAWGGEGDMPRRCHSSAKMRACPDPPVCQAWEEALRHTPQQLK